MGRIIIGAAFAGFIAFCLFSLYVLFVFVPVLMYAEAECLRNGYPKTQVSIGLERYCMTLDGLVQVKMVKVVKP